MGKSIINNEHVIQCALLYEFSSKKKKNRRDSKIWQYDKPLKYHTPISINDCEVYHEIYPQNIENRLGKKIENSGITKIRRIKKLRSIQFLSQEEKKLLIKYILIQFFRTPQFLDDLKKSLYRKQEINPQFIYLIDKIAHDVFLKKNNELLNDNLKFPFQLGLIENKTSIPFIFSDNPAIIYHTQGENYAKFIWNFIMIDNTVCGGELNYIFSKSSIIILPINPREFLYLYQLSEFNSKSEKAEEFIQFINSNIFFQAKKFIYSHEKLENKFIGGDITKEIKRKIINRNQKINSIKKKKFEEIQIPKFFIENAKGINERFSSTLEPSELKDWTSFQKFLRDNKDLPISNKYIEAKLGPEVLEKFELFLHQNFTSLNPINRFSLEFILLSILKKINN